MMWETCSRSEVSIIRYRQCIVDTCSRAGLSLSLDRVRISSVKMHRRMFLEKVENWLLIFSN